MAALAVKGAVAFGLCYVPFHARFGRKFYLPTRQDMAKCRIPFGKGRARQSSETKAWPDASFSHLQWSALKAACDIRCRQALGVLLVIVVEAGADKAIAPLLKAHLRQVHNQ